MTDPTSQTTSRVNFRAEVAAYDREAEVGRWAGPRHRVTYRALGQGPPLILVPGLASTYRGYAPTLNRLARRYRTVQLDYPGEHPDDGADLGSISHDDLVDDLAGLAGHLGLDRPGLFGLSFGSTVVLRALSRSPGRFPRAALQGGFARRRLRPTERVALAVGRRIRGNTSRLPFHDRGLARNNKETFPGDRPEVWSYYVEQNGLTPIAALSHRLDLLDRLDLRPLLPGIAQEVLVLHGTEDRIVPWRYHEELVAGLPNARAVPMAGVGHQPHFTHADEMAGILVDFFAADRDRIA